jgi:hypothetical protein
MPAPTKQINIGVMQNIANDIKPGQFNNAMALCSFIAGEYNKQNNIPVKVDHQLVKLRIVAGIIKLSFPLPVGKRGRQAGVPISSAQKEKMQAGRVNKKKINTVGNGMEKWRQNMQESFSSKKILQDGILAGRKNSCVKGMCIQCVGGYSNRSQKDPPISDAIRDCRGYSCPLYPIRPFQKKTEE